MKRFAIHVLILAGLGLGAATTIVGLGLYNVSARLGHLPGVSWVLHTAYRNSVRRYAPPESEIPDLGRPGLVALGAGHYRAACSVCHGAPGEPRSATAMAMEPPPPPIAAAVQKWQPNHLFWIVRNGVKMTGMPAWPADRRKDEVWAVVAFLEQVADMDPAAYRALTAPPPVSGTAPAGLADCAVCHGADGAGAANPRIPRLDIQTEIYLARALEAYRLGTRSSGIMQHAASGLDATEIAALAAHYAASGPPSPSARPRAADPALVERGRALATEGSNASGVPACAACHGPWPTELSPLFPSLSGQHEPYLLGQLEQFKAGTRGGSELAIMMHKVMAELDEGEMRALAAYYASLPARHADP